MKILLFQVDAFTQNVFGGNPAAVCVLEQWFPDTVLQNIALENNLAETAFFAPSHDPAYDYHLRWFTPTTEVDLCGHATLASAYVIFEELHFKKTEIRFQSRSGLLSVQKSTHGYTLNFPEWDYTVREDVSEIEAILELKVQAVLQNAKTFAILDVTPETIKNFIPDISKIKTLKNTLGLVITARGKGDIDFVSRYFGPQLGIDEDPVTGSTHCFLAPYWGKILGKIEMRAQQLSARGGNLFLELKDNRVHISGHAVLYLKGEILV